MITTTSMSARCPMCEKETPVAEAPVSCCAHCGADFVIPRATPPVAESESPSPPKPVTAADRARTLAAIGACINLGVSLVSVWLSQLRYEGWNAMAGLVFVVPAMMLVGGLQTLAAWSSFRSGGRTMWLLHAAGPFVTFGSMLVVFAKSITDTHGDC